MLRFGIPKPLTSKGIRKRDKYIGNTGVDIKTNTHIESIDKLFETRLSGRYQQRWGRIKGKS